MASHRVLATNRQDRLGPRSPRIPRSPRSPRFPRPAAAKVQRCYRKRGLLAAYISPIQFPLSFLAVDVFGSILSRAPSLLPGYPSHASRAINMDSEDGELFVKVSLEENGTSNHPWARRQRLTKFDPTATYHICAYARESFGQRFAATKAECPTTWRITQRIFCHYQWPHIANRCRTTSHIRSIFIEWPRLCPVIWRFELHSPSPKVRKAGSHSAPSVLPAVSL